MTSRSSEVSKPSRSRVRAGTSSASAQPGAGNESSPGRPLPNRLGTVTKEAERARLTSSKERVHYGLLAEQHHVLVLP
jgi:hypothetical protein